MQRDHTTAMLRQGEAWRDPVVQRAARQAQAKRDLASLLQVAVVPKTDAAASLRRLLGLPER